MRRNPSSILRHVSLQSRPRVDLRLASTSTSKPVSSKRSSPGSIPKKNREELESVVNDLVDAAASGPQNPSWAFTRDGGRTEERELRASAKSGGKARTSSRGQAREKTRREDYADLPAFPSVAESGALGDMKTGNLIMAMRNGDAKLGVIIGFEQIDRGMHTVMLDTTGHILSPRLTDIAFCYPSFIPRSVVSQAGLEDIPQNDIEVVARVEILKKLRHVEASAGRALTTVTQNGGFLYDQFKALADDKWGRMSLDEAMNFVFGPPKNKPHQIHQAIALKKYLQTSSKEFVMDGISILQSRTYHLRPKANIDTLDIVSGWLQNKDSRIGNFTQKASTLIKQHQELENSTNTPDFPVPATLKTPVEWNDDDMQIISFLRGAMLRQRYIQPDPYDVWLPALLNEVESVTGELPNRPRARNAPSDAFNFLKLIGVYTHWDVLINYGVDGTEMNLRGLRIAPPGTTQAEINAEKRSQELVQASLPVSSSSDLFKLDDGLDPMRKDWKDTPIYVIDAADANELDDGLSIERVPGSDDPWVHVHVADPTSLVHPRDILARSAERQGQTTYFAERTWPMLPPSVSRSIFSLGSPQVPKGVAQPVMTFSMRVNAEGELIDSNVSVGWARNTKVVSYDAVDKALGREPWKVYEPLRSSDPLNINVPTLDPQAMEDLQLLNTIRKRVHARRLKSLGVMEWFQHSLDIQLDNPTSLPISNPTARTPTLYNGFPSGRLLVTHPDSNSPAHQLVQELMVASGPVVSAFAEAHSVPILYRIAPPSTASQSALEEVAKTRDKESGMVNFVEAFKRRIIFGASTYSAKKSPHITMGLDAYARTTSPLRRFPDLINHWQIKAGLRNALLTSSNTAAIDSARALTPRDGGNWPTMFTPEMLQLLAAEHTHLDKMKRRASMANQQSWALMLMHRALQRDLNPPSSSSSTPSDAKAPPPGYVQEKLSNLRAIVMTDATVDSITRGTTYDVTVPDLGSFKATIRVPTNVKYEIGSEVTIKLNTQETVFAIIPKAYAEVVKS